MGARARVVSVTGSTAAARVVDGGLVDADPGIEVVAESWLRDEPVVLLDSRTFVPQAAANAENPNSDRNRRRGSNGCSLTRSASHSLRHPRSGVPLSHDVPGSGSPAAFSQIRRDSLPEFPPLRACPYLLGTLIVEPGKCPFRITEGRSTLRRLGVIAAAMTVLMLLLIPAASAGNVRTYEVTITNLTGGQPLTPPLAATHKKERRPVGGRRSGEPRAPGARRERQYGSVARLARWPQEGVDDLESRGTTSAHNGPGEDWL